MSILGVALTGGAIAMVYYQYKISHSKNIVSMAVKSSENFIMEDGEYED